MDDNELYEFYFSEKMAASQLADVTRKGDPYITIGDNLVHYTYCKPKAEDYDLPKYDDLHKLGESTGDNIIYKMRRS